MTSINKIESTNVYGSLNVKNLYNNLGNIITPSSVNIVGNTTTNDLIVNSKITYADGTIQSTAPLSLSTISSLVYSHSNTLGSYGVTLTNYGNTLTSYSLYLNTCNKGASLNS